MTNRFCYRCAHYRPVRVSELAYTHACALDQPQFPLVSECPCFVLAPFWQQVEQEVTHDPD